MRGLWRTSPQQFAFICSNQTISRFNTKLFWLFEKGLTMRCSAFIKHQKRSKEYSNAKMWLNVLVTNTCQFTFFCKGYFIHDRSINWHVIRKSDDILKFWTLKCIRTKLTYKLVKGDVVERFQFAETTSFSLGKHTFELWPHNLWIRKQLTTTAQYCGQTNFSQVIFFAEHNETSKRNVFSLLFCVLV